MIAVFEVDRYRQIAIGDLTGNRHRIIRLAAQFFEQVAGDPYRSDQRGGNADGTGNEHQRTRQFVGLDAGRGAGFIEPVFDIVERAQFGLPLFLRRQVFFFEELGQFVGFTLHAEVHRLIDELVPGICLRLDLRQRGMLFGYRAGQRIKHLFQLFLGGQIFLGLRLDVGSFFFDIVGAALQHQIAQGNRAFGNRLGHLGHQS